MAIVPDVKDWTWVLERPCPECGFAPGDLSATEVAAGLRANAGAWRALLDDPAVAARPSEDRWSALEYACHVRDVFHLGSYRIGLMLDEDDPTFANWDQDETAVAERYADQDPARVLDGLEAAGEALAALLDGVPDGAWDRSGVRSDGARFTVASFARYVLHDPVHHVWDVEQGYVALAAASAP
jgi:hypothetical protein